MEETLKLHYPVFTVDCRELLPAGTLVTREIMDDLVRRARKEPFSSVPFMEYGTLGGDLSRLIQQAPYDRVFSDQSRTSELFSIMGKVEYPEQLLETVQEFKTFDPYTYRHILVVFALALLLAQDLLADQKDLAREAMSAPTHDVGKFCVPLEVLTKSTRLSESEERQLEHHSAAGYVLLSYYLRDADHPAAVTARDHHERDDGSGYPRGIPLRNRLVEIVAVGDLFDALIAQRPYRPTPYDLRTALEEVTAMGERGAINWEVVQALISHIRQTHPDPSRCIVSREKRGTPPEDNLYRGVRRPGVRTEDERET